MLEQHNEDTYITCSRCNKKYQDTDESVKQHFGYDKLNERFKVCAMCRQYKLDNRERILQQGRERWKEYYQENKDVILEKKKEYRENNNDKINEKVECSICGVSISKHGLARHQRSNKCKKAISNGKEDHKQNASTKSDNYRRYCEPCSVCNMSICKYQMSKHQASPICSAYAERAT